MPHRESAQDGKVLALLAQDRDEALTLLFNCYYNLLVARVQVQLKNKMDADEIVQELFIAIWQKRKTLNLKPPLLRYLLKAVSNRTRNFLRNRAQLRAKEFPVHNLQPFEHLLTSVPPDGALYVKEIAAHVRLAQQQMTRSVRRAFILSRTHGKTYAAIAAELGVSVKAIEKRMARALKILKDVFEKYEART